MEKYDDTMAEKICSLIASGQSLKKITHKRGYPSFRDVCRWRQQDQHFNQMLAGAYQQKRFFFLESITDLLGDVTPENVACMKLKIDTLKWLVQSMDDRDSPSHKEEEHDLKERLERAYDRLQKMDGG